MGDANVNIAMHFLGLDIGTSAAKAALVDERQAVVAQAAAPIATHNPRPGWSEQDPEDWWRATETVVAALRQRAAAAFADIRAIGLSGQMHGAVVLDAAGRLLRPAILWNDGRATAECAMLAAAVPRLAEIAGVIAMPGFTAPKVLWLRTHEPDAFTRIAHVVLAKDYVRLRLTGEIATDVSDAAGTLLLDEAARGWSAPLLAATGLDPARMPRLSESNAPSGMLRPALAAAWGLASPVVVAAGAGDVAAGAIGVGAIGEGDGFVSLGTSAQIFRARDRYQPKPETLIHAFAHALPGRWFEMAALLNGATCLEWIARVLGADVARLIDEVAASFKGPSPVLFLPYLSGERTPLNDPDARGAFANLSYATGRVDLVQAVLEGVAFSLRDGALAFGDAGRSGALPIIGGGARSRLWLQIIASALGRPLQRIAAADIGPAFGAARLARLALTGEAAGAVCAKPEVEETVDPDPTLQAAYAARFPVFRGLYRGLRKARAATADRPPAATQ